MIPKFRAKAFHHVFTACLLLLFVCVLGEAQSKNFYYPNVKIEINIENNALSQWMSTGHTISRPAPQPPITPPEAEGDSAEVAAEEAVVVAALPDNRT